MTVLGALETSATGIIANSVILSKMSKGMGGAMDLELSPTTTKVLVIQSRVDTHWGPKIKEKCDLPLTGKDCVHKIITELSCSDVNEKGLVLRDHKPQGSVAEIRGTTGAKFEVGRDCKPWKLPDVQKDVR